MRHACAMRNANDTPATVRRGRPPRTPEGGLLSRELIQREALALIEEEGVDAVSMRKVARRLGVDPMSLYNHVENKGELLDGVADLLLASIPVVTPGPDLRASMRVLARTFRNTMLKHPQAAPLVLSRYLESSAALSTMESALGPLLSAGYPPDLAVHGVRAVLAYLLGTLMREVGTAETFGSATAEDTRHRRETLEESGLPAVASAAEHLAACDAETEFEFGLNVLINALIGPDGRPPA
jgi:TetR/AcrR family tetracycline transcriptional repressor